MFCVAPHLEGFQQQGACVVARAGKGLAAVRELCFSFADFRKDEGFQRPNKLVKTILGRFFFESLEQGIQATNDPVRCV